MTDQPITFFLDSLNIGGAEKVAITLANFLHDNGYNITILTLNKSHNALATKLNPDIRIDSLEVQSTSRAIIPLIKYCRSNKPSYFFVFHYQITLILILIRCFYLIPKMTLIARCVSTMSRRLTFGKRPFSIWFTRLLFHRLYRYSDYIIAQSKGMADDLIENFNIPEKKITVIYNPLSETILQNHDNHKERKNYILCVGRLEKVKNFDHVIDIFPNLLKQHPTLQLKIVGDGSYRQEWENLSKQMGLQESVIFEGMKENTHDYYKQAQLTILSSTYEGFPNILVESIALGTPVIAYNCQSGPSEIIKDGLNGFLVNHMDKNDLTDKITMGLKNNWNYDDIRDSAMFVYPDKILNDYKLFLDQVTT